MEKSNRTSFLGNLFSLLMSRADYLAKYLGSSKKKKSKASRVVVVQKPLLSDHSEPVQEEDPESVPIVTTKEFKGFRRIDDGQAPKQADEPKLDEPKPEEPKPEEPVNQKTVYRDSSGRIVDINERRQQLQDQKPTTHEVKLLEEEIERQSRPPAKRTYVYDDPMPIFSNSTENALSNSADDSRYHYTGGMMPVNRFHIKAGSFWDGIDRSNGFETLVLRLQNNTGFEKLERRINESYEVDLD